MMTTTLLTEVAAPGTSGTQQLRTDSSKDDFVLQVVISGTATVALEGRVSPDLPWVQIDSLTSSAVNVYARVPQIRVNVLSVAGTVTVAIAS